jgi:hypothetical protein
MLTLEQLQEASQNENMLADVIWWIKGYMKACEDNKTECHFSDDHLKALRASKFIFSDMQKPPQVKRVDKPGPIKIVKGSKTVQ